jgi:hypothetical protein
MPYPIVLEPGQALFHCCSHCSRIVPVFETNIPPRGTVTILFDFPGDEMDATCANCNRRFFWTPRGGTRAS